MLVILTVLVTVGVLMPVVGRGEREYVRVTEGVADMEWEGVPDMESVTLRVRDKVTVVVVVMVNDTV